MNSKSGWMERSNLEFTRGARSEPRRAASSAGHVGHVKQRDRSGSERWGGGGRGRGRIRPSAVERRRRVRWLRLRRRGFFAIEMILCIRAVDFPRGRAARLRGTRATRSVRGFDVSSRGRQTRSRRGEGIAETPEERQKGATDKRRKIKEEGKADGERWVKGRGVARRREGERSRGRVCLNQGDKGSKKQGGAEGERGRSAPRVRKELDLLGASQARRTECNAIRR